MKLDLRAFCDGFAKAAGDRASKKISKLMKSEGKSQDQAVAMALNMESEGRLGPKGGYRRKRDG